MLCDYGDPVAYVLVNRSSNFIVSFGTDKDKREMHYMRTLLDIVTAQYHTLHCNVVEGSAAEATLLGAGFKYDKGEYVYACDPR